MLTPSTTASRNVGTTLRCTATESPRQQLSHGGVPRSSEGDPTLHNCGVRPAVTATLSVRRAWGERGAVRPPRLRWRPPHDHCAPRLLQCATRVLRNVASRADDDVEQTFDAGLITDDRVASMAANEGDMTMISLQISVKKAAVLTRRAEKEGISRSKLIRELLDAGLRRRVDPGSEMRRLRQEVERLSGLVEASLRKRR